MALFFDFFINFNAISENLSIFAAQFEQVNNNQTHYYKMKKVFLTVIAFMVVSSTAMAAGHVDSVRYLTTKFWQNWFISADGSVNWWQGSDKYPDGNYTAVQWNKPSFGASVNVGKWINHKFGLRLAYDVNPGKSYLNGRHTYSSCHFLVADDAQPDANGYYNTNFMYHNLHADLFFSPIDFFQGYYNPQRVYTPVFYAGMGLATVCESVFVTPTLIYNMQHKDEVEVYQGRERTAQKGRNSEFSFNAGLINNFRISNHFDLHLDLKWSAQRWNIDSWFNETGGLANYEGPSVGSDIRPKLIDNNYSIGLGATYYFSRVYDMPNNCCEEMEEMRKRLKNLEDEMNNIPEPVHDTVVKFVNMQTEDIVSYPFSIFFNRDSYKLMSGRDLVNLREIAEVAKANGYKLRLRGSCDSATATPAYNQTLSENRCRKIMMELMEMGIPESQIILVPMGGVKELDPTEYDRRVLIELIKEAPKN